MKTSVASVERSSPGCMTEIFFPEGIIGFEKHKEYSIIGEKSKEPFYWMQSKENPEVSFIIIDPKEFMPQYSPSVSGLDKKSLQVEDINDCQCFSIVTVSETEDKITANLLAPLFVNKKENVSRQVILQDQDYPVQFLILEEMMKKIEERNVSSFTETK